MFPVMAAAMALSASQLAVVQGLILIAGAMALPLKIFQVWPQEFIPLA